MLLYSLQLLTTIAYTLSHIVSKPIAGNSFCIMEHYKCYDVNVVK